MSSGDQYPFYDLASDTWSIGNATATGPNSFGQTFNWEPSTTIDFSPSELTWAPTEFTMTPTPTGFTMTPAPDLSGDMLVNIRSELAKQWAKQLDNLIMNGLTYTIEEKKMPQNEERTLYNVFVIDPDGDGVVVATLENVVAKDVAAAEKKAVFALASDPETQKKLSKDLEDYDFLVEDVADFGSIRAKKND